MTDFICTYHPFTGCIKNGIESIQGSTEKILHNEREVFDIYVDIIKHRNNELESQLELEIRSEEELQEEIARLTEVLSKRECDLESKEGRLFELEKLIDISLKQEKKYEKELNKIIREKEDLIKQLADAHNKLQDLRNQVSLKKNDEMSTIQALRNRKRRSNDSKGINGEEETTIKKRGRLKRPETDDLTENIDKMKDSVVSKSNNPLGEILCKTNLGRLRPPTLRGRVVRAAEAASPNIEDAPELKTLDKFTSAKPKKASKIAKIAKIPQYNENILNAMKVAELKDICTELHLEFSNRTRKSDLIHMILSFQNE
ncbi:uncharacterized protein CMU_002790 [Cryptosporidium muris RN66]|uniref:Rho termination factor-like N-terminal domain-containing protein n=1 Tax=Cryptosporidium muris (strain RN66) TaxID=441375 RepID=B6AJQ8_CRYMR|nr:uncharacterized protein CMU_002790 [Cryptosporidium muris RN66]EEA08449.1 hypothetical protein, conserved [Cryptosporidium muris RN66]|eukprot:XP_002142798.1 hypothetical protein [Cryptosporidium muris RN66]